MKHETARQIKWDLVDHLLVCLAEGGVALGADYTPEEREYAQGQIRRIAGMLNVRDHIYL
jgi:hypothetical protein